MRLDFDSSVGDGRGLECTKPLPSYVRGVAAKPQIDTIGLGSPSSLVFMRYRSKVQDLSKETQWNAACGFNTDVS